jgi:GntR family transcriptional regulator, arabinose operon transcriptional repressor
MPSKPIKKDRIMAPSLTVADRLRQAICQGTYLPGTRLPGEQKLAARFGVSRGTVRKALAILAEQRLVSSQHGRGTFVSNPAYADPDPVGTAMIGMMVFEKEYYFGPMLREGASYASRRGYVLATGSNATVEDETLHLKAFIDSGVKGVILAARPGYSRQSYEQLRRENIPVVLIDTLLGGVDEDFVSVDDRAGIAMATRHLIEQAHTRIAYVGGDDTDNIPCQPERFRGFQQGGVEVPPAWCVAANDDNYPEKLEQLLAAKDRPTAIVAFSDTWAVRIMGVARRLGLTIPEDLSVTGFDDSLVARQYDIPLTTVHPQFSELAITAINVLLDKIQQPRPRPTYRILVTPELIIRESTVPPPASE